MSSSTIQIEKDIMFLQDICDMTNDQCDMGDEQIGEMLRCIERLGIASVEHFCEEFIFIDEDGGFSDRLHDDEYLSIAEFNAMYWEGN